MGRRLIAVTTSGLVFVVGFTLVLFGLVIGASVRSANRHTSSWIVRHGLRDPGARHIVRVWGTSSAWNPAGTYPDNRIFTAGTAVYSRDTIAGDDVITLQFTPKGGQTYTVHGPVPDHLRTDPLYGGGARRGRMLPLWALLVGQTALGILGAGIGLASTTSGTNAREVAVVMGGLSGILLVPLGLQVSLVARAILKTMRHDASPN